MDVGSRFRSTVTQNYDIYQRNGRENGHIRTYPGGAVQTPKFQLRKRDGRRQMVLTESIHHRDRRTDAFS